MAAKTPKLATTVVRCSVCGKEIPNGEGGIPVDYVWKSGKNYCWDCISNNGQKKEEEKK